MILSYVLRLVSEALESGQLVGQIEDVDTGETVVIKDLQELLAFLQGHVHHKAQGHM